MSEVPEPIVAVDRLTKRFAEIAAVDGFDARGRLAAAFGTRLRSPPPPADIVPGRADIRGRANIAAAVLGPHSRARRGNPCGLYQDSNSNSLSFQRPIIRAEGKITAYHSQNSTAGRVASGAVTP